MPNWKVTGRFEMEIEDIAELEDAKKEAINQLCEALGVYPAEQTVLDFKAERIEPPAWYAILATNIDEIVGVQSGDLAEAGTQLIPISKDEFDHYGDDYEDDWSTMEELTDRRAHTVT